MLPPGFPHIERRYGGGDETALPSPTIHEAPFEFLEQEDPESDKGNREGSEGTGTNHQVVEPRKNENRLGLITRGNQEASQARG